MKRIALFFGGLILAGCTTIAPPKDFPQIPLPETTQLEAVSATRTEGGFLLTDEDYQKTLRMVQGMKAEIEQLRKIIETYNEWAKARRDE